MKYIKKLEKEKQYPNYKTSLELIKNKSNLRGTVLGINYPHEKVRVQTRKLIKSGKLKMNLFCEKCGCKENLSIHHISYENEQNSIKTLCKSCHAKFHIHLRWNENKKQKMATVRLPKTLLTELFEFKQTTSTPIWKVIEFLLNSYEANRK